MKSKKQAFNFKKEYKESWEFIKSSRKFIYSAIGIFVVFMFVGFFFLPPENILNYITNMLEELFALTEGMAIPELIGFIFLNNFQAAFFAMLLGVILGVPSILSTIFNGYVVGIVIRSVILSEEGSFLDLWRLLPHGIFELTAIFIAFGLGIKLGSFIFQKDPGKSLKEFFVKSIKVFILVIFPLLVIAAIIEGVLIGLGI